MLFYKIVCKNSINCFNKYLTKLCFNMYKF